MPDIFKDQQKRVSETKKAKFFLWGMKRRIIAFELLSRFHFSTEDLQQQKPLGGGSCCGGSLLSGSAVQPCFALVVEADTVGN